MKSARMSAKRVLSWVNFDLDPERVRRSPVIDTLVVHELPWGKLSEQKVSCAGGGVKKVQISRLFFFFFPLCVKIRDHVKFYTSGGSSPPQREDSDLQTQTLQCCAPS